MIDSNPLCWNCCFFSMIIIMEQIQKNSYLIVILFFILCIKVRDRILYKIWGWSENFSRFKDEIIKPFNACPHLHHRLCVFRALMYLGLWQQKKDRQAIVGCSAVSVLTDLIDTSIGLLFPAVLGVVELFSLAGMVLLFSLIFIWFTG